MLSSHRVLDHLIQQQFTYSVAGFIPGVIVGFFVRCYKPGNGHRKDRRVRAGKSQGRRQDDSAYDPHAAIPDMIPKIEYDHNGEPLIVREQVSTPSPVPRSIAIILIILAALSVAYNAVQQYQRNSDLHRANDRLARQVEANRVLVTQLSHQQAVINANEQRLEDLVLAISAAKTPGEVTEAIQHFLKSSAQAHAAEQKYQEQQGGQQATHPSSYPRGSGSPPQRPSARPSPSSSARPTASPSRSPRPSPSRTPLACVTTPRGPVCVTVPPLVHIQHVAANRTAAKVSTPTGGNMLNAHVAMLLLAAFISPLVGLLTKWRAPSWLKAFLNLGLTTLAVVISTVVWTDGTRWQVYIINIAQAWAVSIAAHYGFYKPTSAAKKGWFQTPSTAVGDAGISAPVLPHQKRHAHKAHDKHVAA